MLYVSFVKNEIYQMGHVSGDISFVLICISSYRFCFPVLFLFFFSERRRVYVVVVVVMVAHLHYAGNKICEWCFFLILGYHFKRVQTENVFIFRFGICYIGNFFLYEWKVYFQFKDQLYNNKSSKLTSG